MAIQIIEPLLDGANVFWGQKQKLSRPSAGPITHGSLNRIIAIEYWRQCIRMPG
jgi:hypothetical protein